MEVVQDMFLDLEWQPWGCHALGGATQSAKGRDRHTASGCEVLGTRAGVFLSGHQCQYDSERDRTTMLRTTSGSPSCVMRTISSAKLSAPVLLTLIVTTLLSVARTGQWSCR